MKIISVNKSASFEYFIEDRYEAGVVLEGSEVKSLRKNNCNLSDSFCFIRNGEVLLKNMHIAVYDKSGAFNTRESRRDRKLLLAQGRDRQNFRQSHEKGYTASVPLKIYFSRRSSRWKWGFAAASTRLIRKNRCRKRISSAKKERQIKEYLK